MLQSSANTTDWVNTSSRWWWMDSFQHFLQRFGQNPSGIVIRSDGIASYRMPRLNPIKLTFVQLLVFLPLILKPTFCCAIEVGANHANGLLNFRDALGSNASQSYLLPVPYHIKPFLHNSREIRFGQIRITASSFDITLPFPSLGEVVIDKPANDVNNSSYKNSNGWPIYLGRLRWYHWIVFWIVSFFCGAGECLIWRLLKSNAKKRAVATSSWFTSAFQNL